MKALIFNHHPDYIWHLQQALECLGVEVFIATQELTLQTGCTYCSTSSDFKLRTGPVWYKEEDLFGKRIFKYADSTEGMDFIFSMAREPVRNLTFDSSKLYYCACVSWDLDEMNDYTKYTKITSHHDAQNWGAKYLPYFVPQKGELQSKTYITQLIEGFTNSPYLDELLYLKANEWPVVIAGAADAPDGVVNDWHTLQHTSLLVHHKEYGTNCNAVMKALDTGVPVYISRENKQKTGMGDLPDDLFIYSNDMPIHDAYLLSQEVNNKKIQTIFRQIRNVNNTATFLKNILSI
jgi:hypothetical protein